MDLSRRHSTFASLPMPTVMRKPVSSSIILGVYEEAHPPGLPYQGGRLFQAVLLVTILLIGLPRKILEQKGPGLQKFLRNYLGTFLPYPSWPLLKLPT